MLRIIEEEVQKGKMDELQVTTHRDVALFILNHKRTSVADLEARFGLQIVLLSDETFIAPDYRVERIGWQGKNNSRQTPAAGQRLRPATRIKTKRWIPSLVKRTRHPMMRSRSGASAAVGVAAGGGGVVANRKIIRT